LCKRKALDVVPKVCPPDADQRAAVYVWLNERLLHEINAQRYATQLSHRGAALRSRILPLQGSFSDPSKSPLFSFFFFTKGNEK
jgi:hypothetical protein